MSQRESRVQEAQVWLMSSNFEKRQKEIPIQVNELSPEVGSQIKLVEDLTFKLINASDVDEVLDYGYGGDESEEEEEEEQEEEDVGPEDGEEPFNHDMNVLDQEGYGLL
ncbi:hypothetical protein BT96DRAFT_949724 [Gymnopus androsaceus JB14]|uniref:Uncharacterized protein n=1 Tax=Gymnopus androsaceus JB14 TaxID=1447944 RepID=A0A6A4GJQ7_9AGAR|nr:hypothetical protein BT96DRAFT_949724 [Gymnopus androsaceus JB14]